jgi:hypothetical protein
MKISFNLSKLILSILFWFVRREETAARRVTKNGLEEKLMAQIDKWLGDVYLYQGGGGPKNNPIFKCDHYNNSDKEARPD